MTLTSSCHSRVTRSNSAWEVLDLMRAIYEKPLGDDEVTQLRAADTFMFIMQGDISLETSAHFSSEKLKLI